MIVCNVHADQQFYNPDQICKQPDESCKPLYLTSETNLMKILGTLPSSKSTKKTEINRLYNHTKCDEGVAPGTVHPHPILRGQVMRFLLRQTIKPDAWLGLARTIYIRFMYGIFGREITEYTVIYSVYIYGSGQPYAWRMAIYYKIHLKQSLRIHTKKLLRFL